LITRVTPGDPAADPADSRPSLVTVLGEWGRIGCIGFGGPPTHIRLLRDLCVDRRQWLRPVEFEDAVAACNLLPGPASTQLAIFCACRVRGGRGALVGGAAFIVPGLVAILGLAVLFLAGSPPRVVLAAGAGTGSAVGAVAVHAAVGLLPASWRRAHGAGPAVQVRWWCYLAAGVFAAATIGPWVVLVLLACGVLELASRLIRGASRSTGILPHPLLATGALATGALATGGLTSLAWVAFKVGALSLFALRRGVVPPCSPRPPPASSSPPAASPCLIDPGRHHPTRPSDAGLSTVWCEASRRPRGAVTLVLVMWGYSAQVHSYGKRDDECVAKTRRQTPWPFTSRTVPRPITRRSPGFPAR
jgi:chromate transport protein ChrA